MDELISFLFQDSTKVVQGIAKFQNLVFALHKARLFSTNQVTLHNIVEFVPDIPKEAFVKGDYNLLVHSDFKISGFNFRQLILEFFQESIETGNKRTHSSLNRPPAKLQSLSNLISWILTRSRSQAQVSNSFKFNGR